MQRTFSNPVSKSVMVLGSLNFTWRRRAPRDLLNVTHVFCASTASQLQMTTCQSWDAKRTANSFINSISRSEALLRPVLLEYLWNIHHNVTNYALAPKNNGVDGSLNKHQSINQWSALTCSRRIVVLMPCGHRWIHSNHPNDLPGSLRMQQLSWNVEDHTGETAHRLQYLFIYPSHKVASPRSDNSMEDNCQYTLMMPTEIRSIWKSSQRICTDLNMNCGTNNQQQTILAQRWLL